LGLLVESGSTAPSPSRAELGGTGASGVRVSWTASSISGGSEFAVGGSLFDNSLRFLDNSLSLLDDPLGFLGNWSFLGGGASSAVKQSLVGLLVQGTGTTPSPFGAVGFTGASGLETGTAASIFGNGVFAASVLRGN